jgi:ribosomal protein S12 methylthiotransferase accessory factor
MATGTGLAAGNHQLEAVSHALCEVVERDAFAVWDERRVAHRTSRRLDLDTVDDPVCRRRLPAAIGGGCHPDRAVALSRALTEAAQSRLTLIAGSRDDCPPAYYRRIRDGNALATHVARLGKPAERSFADVAHVPAESIDADVAHELDRLKAVGIRQAILIDLTRPGIDIPVVRMVVPGLEGWADKAEPAVPGKRRQALWEQP